MVADFVIFAIFTQFFLFKIAKQDWSKNWPTFTTDIVESSKTNDNICVNNMNILSLLSEGVFDFRQQKPNSG
ncbi:unnamed protein product [Cylicocyclus nassatus]|uniref:Exportin-1/Importin-beta-like domain-containing protein n=1 Tax=Cylicocyclus nassatus TaxID=53992 RepID=A0AA36HDK6_CYLNA|nr:unnamed protein product [Cylicocyclus nassatus]